MGYSVLVSFVLVFSVFSCGSSGEKAAEENRADSVEQSTVKQDTVPDMPPPPDPAPAPGTIRLLGKMLEVQKSDEDNPATIRFKVQKILAIGSSTSSVALQDTLSFNTNSLSDSLKEGNKVIVVLKNQPVLYFGGEKSSPWQLISIKNKKSNNKTDRR